MKKKKEFTVSDGDMTLIVEPAEEGGYLVRSPFDPSLITEAESLEEAFENARDAAEAKHRFWSRLFLPGKDKVGTHERGPLALTCRDDRRLVDLLVLGQQR